MSSRGPRSRLLTKSRNNETTTPGQFTFAPRPPPSVPAILISKNSTSIDSDSEHSSLRVKPDDKGADWSAGSPGSQSRAKTYRVTKGSSRRVTWLTSQKGCDPVNDSSDDNGLEPRSDDVAKGDEMEDIDSSDEDIRMDLLTPDMCYYQDVDEEEEEEEEENAHEQPTSILPVIKPKKQSKSKRKHRMSRNVSPKTSKTSIKRAENSGVLNDDKDSSSMRHRTLFDTSSLLRKEDTFIVTEPKNKTRDLSPNEDLRRRKAMALAKANARHVLKNWNEHHLYHQANQSHYNFTRATLSMDNQKQQRAYMENTGAEVRNDRGEKIYFHWRENEGSVKNSTSIRGPSALRRLYQYKKKRLKRKSPVPASKSAPNKNGSGGNSSGETPSDKHRSKTAGVDPEDKEKEKSNELSIRKTKTKEDGKQKPVAREAFVDTDKKVPKENLSQHRDKQLPSDSKDGHELSGEVATEEGNTDSDKENVKVNNTQPQSSSNHVRFSNLPTHPGIVTAANTAQDKPNEKPGTIANLQSKVKAPYPPSKPRLMNEKPNVPREKNILVPHESKSLPSRGEYQIKKLDNGSLSQKNKMDSSGQLSVATDQKVKSLSNQIVADTTSKSGPGTCSENVSSVPIQNTQETDKLVVNHTVNHQIGQSDEISTNQHYEVNSRKDQLQFGKGNVKMDVSNGVEKNVRDTGNYIANSNESPENNGLDAQGNRAVKTQVTEAKVVGDDATAANQKQTNGDKTISALPAKGRQVAPQRNIPGVTVNVIANQDNQSAQQGLDTQHDVGVTRDNTTTSDKPNTKYNVDELNAKPLIKSPGDTAVYATKEKSSGANRNTSDRTPSDVIDCDLKGFSSSNAGATRVNDKPDLKPLDSVGNIVKTKSTIENTDSNTVLLNDSSKDMIESNNAQNKSNKNSAIAPNKVEEKLVQDYPENQKLKNKPPYRSSQANLVNSTREESGAPDPAENAAKRSQPQGDGVIFHDGNDQYLVNKPTRTGNSLNKKDNNSNSRPGTQNGPTPPQQGQKGVGLSLEDARVTMVTEQTNKNNVTVDDMRKHAPRMKGFVSQSKTTQALHTGENTANYTDGHEDTCNVHSRKSDLQANRKGHFPGRPSKNSADIVNGFGKAVSQSSHKQFTGAEHGGQSIKDASSDQITKLNLSELRNGVEEGSPPLSINRYNIDNVLPSGKSEESITALQHSNRTFKDVPCAKSNTVGDLQTTVQREAVSQSRKTGATELEPETDSTAGNRVGLNSLVNANSVSKIQENSKNRGNGEKALNGTRESINVKGIIHEEIRPSSIPDESYSGRSINNTDADSKGTGSKLTTGSNAAETSHLRTSVKGEKSRNGGYQKTQLDELSNVPSVNTWNGSVKTNLQHGNSSFRQDRRIFSVRGPENHAQRKLGNLRTGKEQQIVSGNIRTLTPNQNQKVVAKDQKKETKHVLSMHTQNLQLRDTRVENAVYSDARATFQNLPLSGMIKSNRLQQYGWKGNMSNTNKIVDSKLSMHQNGSIAQIQKTELSEEGTMNSGILQKPVLVRPKTAGLSAFSRYESEDQWSVNTGEEDDDHIQFIEGEQDFFKVFGYDEETAAILMATRVYPVSHAMNLIDNKGGNNKVSKTSLVNGEYTKTGAINRGMISAPAHDNSETVSGGNKFNGAINKNKISDNTSTINDQKKLAALKKANNSSKGTRAVGKQNADSIKDESDSGHGYQNIQRKQDNTETSPLNVKSTAGNSAINTTTDTGGLHLHSHKKVDQTKRVVRTEKHGTNAKAIMLHQHKISGSKASENPRLDQKQAEVQSEDALLPVSKPSQAPNRTQLQQQPQLLPPSTSTTATSSLLLSDRQVQAQQQNRNRRRIHSEADIPTNSNLDPTHLHTSSEFSHNAVQSPTAAGNIVASDHRTTGKGHISQPGPRNLVQNDNVKDKTRQFNPHNPSVQQNQRPHDTVDIRQTKTRDSIRQPQNKTNDISTRKDSMFNPYTQAADRIMSRFSDTENSINSRNSNNSSSDLNVSQTITNNNNNNINTTNLSHTHSQNLANVKKIAGSPSRRMSHPVDSRTTHAQPGTSFLAPRPRKLKPIMHQPSVGQNQQFTSELK